MIYNNRYVNSEELLESLGIRGRMSGSNISAPCPFHQDSNPSFSVNVDRGIFNCFAGCGSGNIQQLVARVLGCDLIEAHRHIISFSQTDTLTLLKAFDKQKEEHPPLVEIMDEDVLIDDWWGPNWWRERGFDEDDIYNWHIKYEPSTDAVVIPAGNGFIKRYPPNSPIRYKYSDGLDKRNILFGYDRLVGESNILNEILLVEGSLDCLWGVKYGYPTVALLGSSLTGQQLKKLAYLNPKEVVLALDNDEAGWNASVKIAKQLQGKFHLSYLQIPNNKNDLQELTEEELRTAFQNRKDVLEMELLKIPPFN